MIMMIKRTIGIGLCAFILSGCSIAGIWQRIGLGSEDSAAHQAQADVDALRQQLEQQQQVIDTMQRQLKQQRLSLRFNPQADANAGTGSTPTATVATVTFLSGLDQLGTQDVRPAAELMLIPGKPTGQAITISDGSEFVLIQVDLRHTKLRSRFILPISAIAVDDQLQVEIGACDARISSGIIADGATADFTDKLNFYGKPLTSC